MLSSYTVIPLKTMHAHLSDTHLKVTPWLISGSWGLPVCKDICALVL